MATQIIKWLAADGSMFETKEEAERADLIQEVADVLDSAGYSDDYSMTEGAKALLEVYELKKQLSASEEALYGVPEHVIYKTN